MRLFERSARSLVAWSMCFALALLLACESAESASVPEGDHETRDAASSRAPLGADAARAVQRDGGAGADARPDPRAQAKDAASSGADARADGAPDAASDDQMVACATPEEEKFSFFLISYRALQRESGSADGFGGNLGGIDGADAICQRIAEYSSPCQKRKVWRAFLSTTRQHAIDRIGKGPWHDRRGRLIANSLPDLQQERPRGADPQIINDLPNEDGVPNHDPDGTGALDNHQTLTGSGMDGKLYSQGDAGAGGGRGSSSACANGEPWTPEKATCWDWTSAEPAGCPRVGHSWPRQGSGIHWISVWNEGGCAPGAVLADRGGPDGTRRVGSGGGYGGFYCFAVTSP